jgi:predicted heme/steroid binding protein
MATINRRSKGESSAKQDKPATKQATKTTSGLGIKVVLFTVWLVGLFAILHYTEILSLGAFTNYARNMLPRAGERVFTKEELSKHDGQDPSLPLLISVRGRVYDVSKGKKHYSPGTGYNFFTGKDATRSFLTGCFDKDCFAKQPKGVAGLSESELKEIDDWIAFYDKTYEYVGQLPDWDQ